MSITTLPPVAQKVYEFCKKCDCERYHVVLAHTDSETAKIECEVCKKKSKITTKKKKAVTRKPRAVGPKVNSADKWNELLNANSQPLAPYSQKTKYVANSKIEHARFGVGIVTVVSGNQMEVVFQDGTKSLVHNRA